MPVNRTEIIERQPYFFRNNFRRLLTVALSLLLINFLLIGIIFYQFYSRPIVKYFATTSDGRLIEIQPQ